MSTLSYFSVLTCLIPSFDTKLRWTNRFKTIMLFMFMQTDVGRLSEQENKACSFLNLSNPIFVQAVYELPAFFIFAEDFRKPMNSMYSEYHTCQGENKTSQSGQQTQSNFKAFIQIRSPPINRIKSKSAKPGIDCEGD